MSNKKDKSNLVLALIFSVIAIIVFVGTFWLKTAFI
jgi:hypothetical protein